jgi:hypothetical protein
MPFMVGAMLLQLTTPPAPAPAVPFAVGETLEYAGYHSVAFWGSVGSTTLSVVGIEPVQGVPSWHFKLTMQVGVPLYHGHSELASWTGVSDFVSRRFVHVVNENGKQIANDDFRIHPDSGYYRNRTDTLKSPTTALPLDDLAFIYFIRTQPLQDGGVYKYPRYFKKSAPPLVVTVLGHEVMKMPDGSRRNCWVINPVLDEPHGMFSKGANARLWLTDDGVRVPVQIRSGLSFGSVTLKLRKINGR